jgi:hypothetical protein
VIYQVDLKLPLESDANWSMQSRSWLGFGVKLPHFKFMVKSIYAARMPRLSSVERSPAVRSAVSLSPTAEYLRDAKVVSSVRIKSQPVKRAKSINPGERKR